MPRNARVRSRRLSTSKALPLTSRPYGAEGIESVAGQKHETKPLLNRSDGPARSPVRLCRQLGSDAQSLKALKNHSLRVSPRPSGRGSATKEQPLGNCFEVRFRTEKYVVTYFSAESEAKQSDPRKEAASARAASLPRRVEDLNVQGTPRFAREGAGRLSRRRYSCARCRPWVQNHIWRSQAESAVTGLEFGGGSWRRRTFEGQRVFGHCLLLLDLTLVEGNVHMNI